MTSQFTGLVLTIVTLFSLFPTSMWAINNYYDEKYHLVYVSIFIILVEIALFALGLVIVYAYFKRILIWKNSEALLLTAHGHDTSPPSYIHPPNYPPSTVQEVQEIQEIQEIRVDQN
jgi:Ca2+/H+ antiporter